MQDSCKFKACFKATYSPFLVAFQEPAQALTASCLERTRMELQHQSLGQSSSSVPSPETTFKYNWALAEASSICKQAIHSSTLKAKVCTVQALENFLKEAAVGRDLMSCVPEDVTAFILSSWIPSLAKPPSATTMKKTISFLRTQFDSLGRTGDWQGGALLSGTTFALCLLNLQSLLTACSKMSTPS